jgi:hypothetical protein
VSDEAVLRVNDEVVVSDANVSGDKVTAEDGALEDVLTVGSDDCDTSGSGVDNDEAMKGKLKDSGGEAGGTTTDGRPRQTRRLGSSQRTAVSKRTEM